MTIVDTSVWIDFFNGKISRETELLNSLLSDEPVGMGDIILTEVLQGFSSDRDFLRAKRTLEILPIFNLWGKEIAVKSAQNYRFLRKRGITVRKTIDVVIGTFCVENNFPLLHCDRDFDPLKEHLGLIVL